MRVAPRAGLLRLLPATLCWIALAPGCGQSGDDRPAGAAGAGGRAARPNVVLISIDTLRADRLGLYGYERPTSPELEELARDAVVFERFYQNGGGTLPSHMTMMTSLRPAVHGLEPGREGRLPDERTTLAEQLRAAGYATGAWADGGWMRAKFGFDQGFDFYDDEGGRFAAILPQAREWLRQRRSEAQPFFLFLHTYDVHSQDLRLPYSCPGGYPESFTSIAESSFDGCRSGRCATALLAWANSEMGKGTLDPAELFTPAEVEFISALYDGCIRYVDHEIGRLMDHLRELGMYERTLVVVTSDHGEEFLEHGRFLHPQGGFELMVRVPLLLKLPGSEHAGRRVGQLGAMVDLMPTILEVAGVPLNREAQGRSLLPAVREGREVRDEVVIKSTLRTARWKLFAERDLLFDLEVDPHELRNLFEERPQVAEELRARIDRIAALDAAYAKRLEGAPGEADLSEEELRELRALGYL